MTGLLERGSRKQLSREVISHGTSGKKCLEFLEMFLPEVSFGQTPVPDDLQMLRQKYSSRFPLLMESPVGNH